MSKRQGEPLPTRGGRQQRLASLLAASSHGSGASSSGQQATAAVHPQLDSLEFDSELVQHLVFEWAWGHISAVSVQKTAAVACRDQEALLGRLNLSFDHVSKGLRKLASLGNHGKHSGDCNRELQGFLGEPTFPAPLLHQVPLSITKPKAGEEAQQTKDFPIFLPHVLFSHFYNTDRALFERLFLGRYSDASSVEGFWEELERRGDPRLLGHPMKKLQGWKSTMIPISLHGDGVPVLQVGKANSKSLDVLSIQSIFNATGSSLLSKLLICMAFADNMDDESEREIWRILLWSFHWAYMGVWPPVDWNFKPWPPGSAEGQLGQSKTPLAGGWRLVLYNIKGDLDFFANHFHLRHYNANQMCDFCPAHRNESDPSNLYNNFGKTAKWMTKLYSIGQWLKLYDNQPPHPIFKVVGVSQLSIEPDELHIIYLGTSQYLLGSILHLLVYSIMKATPEANMDVLWTMISEFYARYQTSVQYSSLSLGSFVDLKKPHTTFPKLKGKGAEIRDIVGPIQMAWARVVPADHPAQEAVAQLLHDQVSFQVILAEHKDEVLLPVGEARKFADHVHSFLLGYQRLAAKAEANGDFLWNQPTKFHWLWHLADRARFINPRRSCTMVDEDFVGRMKVVTHASSAGTQLHDMSRKSCEKYRWGFTFLFNRK